MRDILNRMMSIILVILHDFDGKSREFYGIRTTKEVQCK